MEALISELPNIILYIVSGFLFVRIFHFVALKDNSNEIDHILSSSLVIGFIIVKIMNFIPWSLSKEIDTLGIVLTSCIIGTISGKIYISGIIDKICDKLRIPSTINKYIWNDLVDKDYPIKVSVQMDDDRIYSGYVHYIEPYNNTPMISLAGYKLENQKSKKDNAVILLNLANAKRVEIEYYSESSKVDDIKDLISNK